MMNRRAFLSLLAVVPLAPLIPKVVSTQLRYNDVPVVSIGNQDPTNVMYFTCYANFLVNNPSQCVVIRNIKHEP